MDPLPKHLPISLAESSAKPDIILSLITILLSDAYLDKEREKKFAILVKLQPSRAGKKT